MKKLFLIPLIVLSSCGKDSEEISGAFRYAQDDNTGVCFTFTNISFTSDGSILQSNHFDARSMTCVPCDSLKKVEVIHFK